MFKLSRVMVVVLIATMLAGAGAYASETNTQDDGYNSSLELIGLDHEEYMRMPDAKRIHYSNFNVLQVESNTQYLRVTEHVDNQPVENGALLSEDDIVTEVVELSKEDYDAEVSEFYNETSGTFHSTQFFDDDTSSTSWITLTTYLSYGGDDSWALSSEVTSLAPNGLLQPVSTHIIGLGVNSNFSVSKDSDYCRRTYKRGILGSEIHEYYDAQHKGASGYAVHYDMNSNERYNTLYFIVAVRPNTSTATIVDGYGHYAKRETSFTPNVTIGPTGITMSVTPNTDVITMPNTHVQLSR